MGCTIIYLPNVLLLPESCILKFPLIFLIIQKRKTSNFLLWKLVRGAYFNQNMLRHGASLQSLIDLLFPEHRWLSLEERFPTLLYAEISPLALRPLSFYIYCIYLTNNYILLNDVPDTVLRVLQIQMISIACNFRRWVACLVLCSCVHSGLPGHDWWSCVRSPGFPPGLVSRDHILL